MRCLTNKFLPRPLSVFPVTPNLGRLFRQVLSLDWPGGFFMSIFEISEAKNFRVFSEEYLHFRKPRYEAEKMKKYRYFFGMRLDKTVFHA